MISQDEMLLRQITSEMCEFLDEQAESIRQTLRQFDALRGAVIRRDGQKLAELMEQTDAAAAQRDSLDVRRVEICRRFGRILGCDAGQVNVTAICGLLDAENRNRIQNRQRVVKELVERLKAERQGTELLLRECRRMNRAILDEITGRSRTLTYTCRGTARDEADGATMSVRL